MQTEDPGVWRRMRWLHRLWMRARGVIAVLAIVRFSLLIPVVLAASLLLADQMIDLLRAVGEDRQRVAVIWLLAASAFTGLIVWYAARTMLRFRFASNPASDPAVYPLLKRWLPRVLGIAIPGELTIRVAELACTSVRPWGLWYFALALLAVTVAVAFYILQRHAIAERTGLHILAVDEHEETRNLARWRELPATTRRVFNVLIALNVVTLVLFSFNGFYQAGLPSTMGAAAILLLGLGMTTVSGSALVYMGNHYAVPILSILAVWVTLCSLNNDNHAVRETAQSTSHGWFSRSSIPRLRSLAKSPLGDLTIDAYFEEWWPELEQSTPAGSSPIPVFVISAEGGGVRAAYWTAMALAELEDATAASPAPFSRHVFAISGVSGGSVGAAVFDASLALRARGFSTEGGVAPLTRFEEMDQVLGRDFLSDTLGDALFPDLLQRFLPAPILDDRAITLERSFERAWKNAHPSGPVQLSDAFHDLWAVIPHAVPLLFLNSTVVETGQRAINSPLATSAEVSDATFADALPLGQLIGTALPLSTAAVLSARFTYVSPAALINTHPDETHRGDLPHWLRLVDGGYFDNSGAVTAQELARALSRAHQRYGAEHPGAADRPMQVIVLHLPNAPEPPSSELKESHRDSGGHELLSEALAPIIALLNTRGARGTQAVSYLHGEPGVILVTIRPCTAHVNAPLGWVLSGEVRREMRQQLQSCDRVGKNCAADRLQRVEDWVRGRASADSSAMDEASCGMAPTAKAP